MALISLTRAKEAILEFVVDRLIPNAPSHLKWKLGGCTIFIPRIVDAKIAEMLPTMKSMGIVNDNGQVDFEDIKKFMHSAFDAASVVEYGGFKFDRDEGEAFLRILEKYKD